MILTYAKSSEVGKSITSAIVDAIAQSHFRPSEVINNRFGILIQSTMEGYDVHCVSEEDLTMLLLTYPPRKVDLNDVTSFASQYTKR